MTDWRFACWSEKGFWVADHWPTGMLRMALTRNLHWVQYSSPLGIISVNFHIVAWVIISNSILLCNSSKCDRDCTRHTHPAFNNSKARVKSCQNMYQMYSAQSALVAAKALLPGSMSSYKAVAESWESLDPSSLHGHARAALPYLTLSCAMILYISVCSAERAKVAQGIVEGCGMMGSVI